MNEEQTQQQLIQKPKKTKPLIIALIVLVLLATTGYTVYAMQQSKIDELNKQIETLSKQNEDTTVESKEPTSSDAESATIYLAIKEWEVKVPQTPKNNILSYQISGETTDFVSSEQKALGGACGTFEVARYHITRKSSSYKPTSEDVIDYQLRNAAHKVTIGNYTYYIIGDMSGGVCDDSQRAGESMTQAEQNANTNLLNSLKGLIAS